jgi:uncharacterized protein YhbP (UPF0306 family)
MQQSLGHLSKGESMDFEGLRGLAAIEDFAVQRPDRGTSAWVRALIKRNTVVVLATTDGDKPWVAPLEYMADEDLNLYFFSSTEARHVRHLEANSAVAATVFDHKQPTVNATTTADLSGVQMECTATRVPPELHTDAVSAAIDAFDISIPPYAVFKVVPHRVYVPRIENGVNIRYEVDMS